jgi:hypothetical protein
MRLLVKIKNYPEKSIFTYSLDERITYSQVHKTLAFLISSGFCSKKLVGKYLKITLSEKGEKVSSAADKLISSLLPD